MKRAPGAERLFQARKAAARELGLPVTDYRVIRLAAMAVTFDALQVQIATGGTVNISELERIDQMLTAARNAKPEPTNVSIRLVGPELVKCPSCGCTFDGDHPERTKMLPNTTDEPVRAVIEGRAVNEAATTSPAPATASVHPPTSTSASLIEAKANPVNETSPTETPTQDDVVKAESPKSPAARDPETGLSPVVDHSAGRYFPARDAQWRTYYGNGGDSGLHNTLNPTGHTNFTIDPRRGSGQ